MTKRTQAEIDAIMRGLSPAEMADMIVLLDELDERKRISLAQNDFLAFIAALDTSYKFGTHLKRLGGLLMGVESGLHDRIAVSMAPRFGKSQMISIYYPAWYLGKHPDHKVIVASHTADLAVDMARKVRNIMQTAEYKRIFPGISIAADAKAAGKWNTNKGGEYFATGVGGALAGRGGHLCLDPLVRVQTLERGLVHAYSVEIGEHLRSWHGWTLVQAKILPEHTTTVMIAGKLKVSAEHPIWTFNRGWVCAIKIQPSDVLWTMTLFDTIKTHLSGVLYGKPKTRTVADPHVQHLGADAAAMHQPESSKLYILRRGWSYCVQSVARLCELLCGHGASPVSAAHAGSDRQHQGVHPGELPVGRCGDTTEQPHKRSQDNGLWRNIVSFAMGTKDGHHQGHGCASNICNGDDSGGSSVCPTHEPQQEAGFTKVSGWFRSCIARLLSRGCDGYDAFSAGAGSDKKEDMAGAFWTCQDILGFLLGVRFAGQIRVEHHAPRHFVNFMVDGDHTFIGDTILSHNCIVDDPHSEQDIKSGNTNSFESTYEWFRAGLRTRLMPEGRLCVLHTRWGQRDLIGRLTKDSSLNEDGDQYEVFEFPAILNEGTPDEKSLWPEQWPLESLLRTKASMPLWQWNAQYQQNPTAQESAIIKRDHIKWWPHEDPPAVDFIIQSFDTALTTKERSDYSVCQTWGVWKNEDGVDNLILLNSVRGKWEFPELKKMALQQAKDWSPDSIIVEAKASGQPLIDEMRRSGLFVQDYSPGKGQDKIARINSISDMFVSGQVWFPETQWAAEVVEELLAFPSGEHDDNCFVANTKITMFDGRECDIINVRKGELVWTPTGPQRVVAAACSNLEAKIVEVIFTDGRVLRGTADHPIYVQASQAFIPLGNLQKGDFVCTSKYFATEELTTVDILIAKTSHCASISTASVMERMRRCTVVYGKMLTGLFQKASTSITKTMTQATTGLITLNASAQLSMVLDIAKMMPHHELCTNGSGDVSPKNRSFRRLQLPTLAYIVGERLHPFKQIAQSFVRLDATTFTTAVGHLKQCVSFVERTLKPLGARLRALTPVKQSGIAEEKLNVTVDGIPHGRRSSTRIHAKNVELSTSQIVLSESYVPKPAKSPEFYACSVSGVRALPNREPVYALQVEGNPVFYANGVLVHNCDALSLALIRARKGGLLRLQSDVTDNDEYLQPRRKAYY